MSQDEARSGFTVDASDNPGTTSNYLLVGDNAYSYSYSGTNLATGVIGDLDTYYLRLGIGHTFTAAVLQSSIFGAGPADADFALLDRYGTVLALSSDYGTYSGYTFTATDTLYYLQVYTSNPGFTTLRLENNSITEANGIGETIVTGRTYNAALDFASDVDKYKFYAVAGVTYAFGIVSSISDIYLDIEYSQLRVDNLVANGSGIYTFTAAVTGEYDLHISSNTFFNTGAYSLITDLTPPTISIGASDSNLTVGETSRITFTLSESSTNFALADIALTSGSLSSFTGSGSSYAATYTPATNSTGTAIISVASGAFSDAVGNFNSAGNSVSMTVNTVSLVDTTPPTISIGASVTNLAVGETSQIIFFLSESSANFALGDVAVSGGSLSNFSGSGTRYAATFTPITNSTTTAVVSVASGVFSDAAGNTNLFSGSISLGVNTVSTDPILLLGRESVESLFGTNQVDAIYGLGGNDFIAGWGSDDLIDGGTGIDTAYYSWVYSEYAVVLGATSTLVIDSAANYRDGTDTLQNIERIQFTDTMLALDTGANENAGNSYLLYQAAFDRTPDVEGLGYWISKVDGGANMVKDVAQNFILSNEFKSLYGANPSVPQFMNLLYQNVLNRAPDQAGLNYWLSEFALAGDSTLYRAGLLNNFAISAENIANVASQIVDGIQYQAYVG
jgi:hypothetical protein